MSSLSAQYASIDWGLAFRLLPWLCGAQSGTTEVLTLRQHAEYVVVIMEYKSDLIFASSIF